VNFNEKLLPLDKNIRFVSKRGKEWLTLVECFNYLVLTGDIQPFRFTSLLIQSYTTDALQPASSETPHSSFRLYFTSDYGLIKVHAY